MLLSTVEYIELEVRMSFDDEVGSNERSAPMDPRDEQPDGPQICVTVVPARSASMPWWRAWGLGKGGAGAVKSTWLAHLLIHVGDILYAGPGLRMLCNYASQKAERSVKYSVIPLRFLPWAKRRPARIVDEFWLYGQIALATAVESLVMSVSLIGEASHPYKAIG